MRKLYFSLIVGFLTANMLFAGIVTNTNQSASWARWVVRDASTGIDAVYFNPAGLMKLNNGFHFSLNNQSIFQTQTITSDYSFLDNTPKTYEANVKVMVFPDVYAVYKMEKFGVSAGYGLGKTGVNDKYQSDISYDLSTSTLGGWFVYGFTNKIQLNLGFDYVIYQDDAVSLGQSPLNFTNIYDKQTMLFAIGLDISF